MNPGPDRIETKAKMDRLLSQANVYRMRGDYIRAEDVLNEALALDESRLDIREMVADMVYARGQLDNALVAYKEILDMAPNRPSIETKYAKVVLEIGEREHQKQRAQDMLENPGRYTTPRRSPAWAMAASVVLPGLGQLYLGQYKRGAIIMGSYLFSWVMIALDITGFKNLLKYFGGLFRPVDTPRNIPLNSAVLFFVGVLVFLYIYAVIDAPISAAKKDTDPQV